MPLMVRRIIIAQNGVLLAVGVLLLALVILLKRTPRCQCISSEWVWIVVVAVMTVLVSFGIGWRLPMLLGEDPIACLPNGHGQQRVSS